MQRQKSMLIFLKPQSSGGGTSQEKTAAPSPLLLPSQALNTNSLDPKAESKLQLTADSKGDETSIIQSLTDKYRGPEDIGNGYLGPKHLSKHNEFNASKTISSNGKKWCSFETRRDDIVVPDKLGMRPVVPGLKRVQESLFNYKENADVSASSCNKRQKILMTSVIGTKYHDDDFKLISKFEWLHPSRIKDANGRNIGDPLYDNGTLYIPPDALSRMSASQRQYWNVKRQYMVIQRKLVRVLSPATNDDNIGPDAVHLLAIKENGSTGFGFAFVDCAALNLWVGSISDDISCAALGALLMQDSRMKLREHLRSIV